MGDQPQVVLLGDSVLMDSLANNLYDQQLLDIIRINSSSLKISQLAKSLEPDLIIYEYSTKFTQLMHELVNKQADTQLLVIDLFCSQVIVLNCQLRPTTTMQELCELIKEEVQRCSQRKEVF